MVKPIMYKTSPTINSMLSNSIGTNVSKMKSIKKKILTDLLIFMYLLLNDDVSYNRARTFFDTDFMIRPNITKYRITNIHTPPKDGFIIGRNFIQII